MRKVELLPIRDCEAGYGPDSGIILNDLLAASGLTNRLQPN